MLPRLYFVDRDDAVYPLHGFEQRLGIGFVERTSSDDRSTPEVIL